MKKPYAIVGGFFILGMLDSMLAYTLPLDFTFQSLSVIWHFYLIGVMVYTHDKPWLTRILVGMLAGLCYDGLVTGTFPACMFSFPIMAWLGGLFPVWLKSSERRTVWLIFLLFMGDLFTYFLMESTGRLSVSLLSWFYHFELLTLIFSSLSVILVFYIDLVIVRWALFQSRFVPRNKVPSLASKVRTPNRNHPRKL